VTEREAELDELPTDGSGEPDTAPAGEATAESGGNSNGASTDPAPGGEATDVLPDDLQPHLVDPEDYVFPNNNRRRVPGYLYLAIALGLVLLFLWQRESPLVNEGFLLASVILAAFGVYSIVSGANLNIDERDALVVASSEVGFPVGHASAQMGWRGLLSRPT
jgi:hypothetical protein